MSATAEMLPLSAARQALAMAETVPEVKLLRDQAATFQDYVRRQRLGLEKQNEVAEIKLRCERKLGDLLEATVHHQGGRPPANSHGALPFRGLPEGVTKMQSHRWQHEARVPEHVFEAWMAETREKGHELTTAGLLALAGPVREDRDGANDDDDLGVGGHAGTGTEPIVTETGTGSSGGTGGYPRTMMLTFEVETHKEVVKRLRSLEPRFTTTNHSDTILALLRETGPQE
jgi:hypothetical protein